MNQDMQNWTILVVDDEKDNLEIAARILAFNGATVHTARHGEEGMEVLLNLNLKPTIILMDLSMPRMSGWDMLKAVRANPLIAHTPVIAVTAHVTSESEDQVKAAGFDGYLTKPFGIAALVSEVKRTVSLNIHPLDTSAPNPKPFQHDPDGRLTPYL